MAGVRVASHADGPHSPHTFSLDLFVRADPFTHRGQRIALLGAGCMHAAAAECDRHRTPMTTRTITTRPRRRFASTFHAVDTRNGVARCGAQRVARCAGGLPIAPGRVAAAARRRSATNCRRPANSSTRPGRSPKRVMRSFSPRKPATELHCDPREKIAALTTSSADPHRGASRRSISRRAELADANWSWPGLAKQELKSALDEQKRTLEQERAQWTEELHNLREMLDHRGEASRARRAWQRCSGRTRVPSRRQSASTTSRRQIKPSRESGARLDRRAVRQVAAAAGRRSSRLETRQGNVP